MGVLAFSSAHAGQPGCYPTCYPSRDLKSANILLTDSDDVKLADFGVSTSIRTRSVASTIVGTPYAMAPEVLNAGLEETYGEPADVWALGVVIYELLVLKRPFEGKTLAVVLKRISRAQYDEDALSQCGHPVSLQELASRDALLNPDPAQRLKLGELQGRLDAIATAGPVA